MANESDAEKEKAANIAEEEEEEEQEKWVKYYSSNHQILLVGEGDFSFSLSLALSFDSASNIVATSLDTYDDLIKKYQKAKPNLDQLETLGAYLLHGVDATNMKLHADLQMRKFDRIVFNFPHAGFCLKEHNPMMIQKHRNLVCGFFKNASGMLRASGEIHVNHKTSAPFSDWNIVDLALYSSLELIESLAFNKEDYPGYNNKRGDGPRCDWPFPLGECSTFKFRFSAALKKMSKLKKGKNQHRRKPTQLQEVPIRWQPEPAFLEPSYTQKDMHVFPEYEGLPLPSMRNFPMISHNNFNHLESERAGYDMRYPSSGVLGLHERYMTEAPRAYERPLIEARQDSERLSTLPRDSERCVVHIPRAFERPLIELPRIFQRPLVGIPGYMDRHIIATPRAFAGPVVEESRAVERGMIRGPGSFERHLIEAPRPVEHLAERAGAYQAHWMGPRPPTSQEVEASWPLGNHMRQHPRVLERHFPETSRDVERDLLMAPGRTLNGDIYLLHELERQRAIESLRLVRQFGYYHQP